MELSKNDNRIYEDDLLNYTGIIKESVRNYKGIIRELQRKYRGIPKRHSPCDGVGGEIPWGRAERTAPNRTCTCTFVCMVTPPRGPPFLPPMVSPLPSVWCGGGSFEMKNYNRSIKES